MPVDLDEAFDQMGPVFSEEDVLGTVSDASQASAPDDVPIGGPLPTGVVPLNTSDVPLVSCAPIENSSPIEQNTAPPPLDETSDMRTQAITNESSDTGNGALSQPNTAASLDYTANQPIHPTADTTAIDSETDRAETDRAVASIMPSNERLATECVIAPNDVLSEAVKSIDSQAVSSTSKTPKKKKYISEEIVISDSESDCGSTPARDLPKGNITYAVHDID